MRCLGPGTGERSGTVGSLDQGTWREDGSLIGVRDGSGSGRKPNPIEIEIEKWKQNVQKRGSFCTESIETQDSRVAAFV